MNQYICCIYSFKSLAVHVSWQTQRAYKLQLTKQNVQNTSIRSDDFVSKKTFLKLIFALSAR